MKKELFSKADILRGLKLEQFEVYYQPIIDKQKNTILSGEALVRWNHPQLGFLHPISFITAAENNGAIVALGEFVLREACSQSKRWREAGHLFFKVTVNLSFVQLLENNFIEKTLKIINETAIDPKDLELEITESLAMVDPEGTERSLLKLQEVGIRVILDDFGAGYSSLLHLSRLPFNGLKIDGQIIKQSLETIKNTKLMSSIISLARSIDLNIVAEGVETKEQLDMLKEMNCHHVQGFYFTRPLPSKEYKEWCTYFLSTPELRM